MRSSSYLCRSRWTTWLHRLPGKQSFYSKLLLGLASVTACGLEADFAESCSTERKAQEVSNLGSLSEDIMLTQVIVKGGGWDL